MTIGCSASASSVSGALQQRVLGRHHHAAVPLVDRQRDQLGVAGDRLGGHAHVGLAGEHLLADLRRVALVDHQLDLRVAPLEGGDRLGQGIARLGVSGGYRQSAELVVGELLAGAAQVLRLGEDALGDGDHRLARLGDRNQALAVAHEHLDLQLVLQRADLLGHPRLGGVQGLGGLGHVQAAAGDFGEAAQLLELHRASGPVEFIYLE